MFPTDETTLQLIWLSLHVRNVYPEATQTHLQACLEFIGQMKGTTYSSEDVIRSLLTEVRQLRGE
jgi:hypothetical protein